MSFSPERLAELRRLPRPRSYRVALSGGLDSVVLLHAMAALGPALGAELSAVHVNHGLHPRADDWAGLCARLCTGLGVPLRTVPAQVTPGPGESLEAAAREARYRALAASMSPGDAVVSAQHRDDQAETVLLQLLRGSGPAGLAAMPGQAPLGPGLLLRPLLGFPRAALEDWARDAGLDWVDDPSNADPRFDRNFLRREVIPLLRTRWPALDRTLARSAAHCAEARSLIDALAAEDMAALRRPDGGLSAAPLQELGPQRARAALRRWIADQGGATPDAARLDRILGEVVPAAPDRSPRVHWSGVEVRRFRGTLYLTGVEAPAPDAELVWDGRSPLPLPGGGTLHAEPGRAGLDPAAWADAPLRVRFRRGGERCRPRGRAHSQSLKRLFQERDVPPWVRARVPLVYAGDRLAAVGDLWVCEPFFTEAPQGVALRWER
jgi:tRNA(Ile)-lysidine synthase